MAGTFTVTGLASGLLSGQKTVGPLTMTGSATIGTIIDSSLVSGDNTISVPAGATAALVVIPSGNTATLKLRTNLNSGDAGLTFGPSGWLVYPLPGTATSLIINATAAVAVETTFI